MEYWSEEHPVWRDVGGEGRGGIGGPMDDPVWGTLAWVAIVLAIAWVAREVA